ncbi:MAG: glycosyl transferase family 2 [Clostridia bacterium]|nr:glycosyl transferase family 2 [Clostridia bacterium]
MNHKYVIGLPAYNEEKNIAKLLDKINSLKTTFGNSLHVIIVNDGSTDDTEAVLKKYSSQFTYISYINHPQNLGLGNAMNTLLQYAVKNLDDQDVLITFDADNTHNPNIIPNMIDMLFLKNLDIVIASRFTKGGKEIGLSRIRKIYSRGAMVFCRLVFHIHNVKDYSCGYRAYHIGFLKKLIEQYGGKVLNSKGFECMVEILAKAGKIGVKAGEYPLVLEYNLKEGQSKMNVKKTIMGYMRLALKVRKPKTRIGV